jgi:hypothetical protein
MRAVGQKKIHTVFRRIYEPMTNYVSVGCRKFNYGEYFSVDKIKEEHKRWSGRMA